jgi:hypothetical protein
MGKNNEAGGDWYLEPNRQTLEQIAIYYQHDGVCLSDWVPLPSASRIARRAPVRRECQADRRRLMADSFPIPLDPQPHPSLF